MPHSLSYCLAAMKHSAAFIALIYSALASCVIAVALPEVERQVSNSSRPENDFAGRDTYFTGTTNFNVDFIWKANSGNPGDTCTQYYELGKVRSLFTFMTKYSIT